MSDQQRSALWLAIAVILIGGCTLLWFHFLEKRPEGVSWHSVEADENPMLAATRLLKQHHFSVRQSETLEQALTPGLGKGNMFINASSGEIDDKQMKSLMNWVAAGNTLVFQPRWSGKLDIVRSAREGECGKMAVRPTDEDDEDERSQKEDGADDASGGGASGDGATSGHRQEQDSETAPASSSASSSSTAGKASAKPPAGGTEDDDDETSRKMREKAEKAMDERAQDVASGKPDQISRKLHLELRRIQYLRPRKEDRADAARQPMRDAPCLSQLRWPGATYDLRVDNRYGWFKPLNGATAAKISDNHGEAVRIYAEGKGHIVLLAENFFNNHMLARYDHAELLLQVMQFDEVPHKLTIIQHLSNRQWYEKLWDHFSLMLMSLALLLALLLWSAVRRFGAVLPLPEPERRALLEHVDASGRWLWQVEKGGQTMLDAMRKLVDKTLSRRVPQLVRLSREEQLELLVQATSMNRLALELALFKPVATLPQQFIRQIHTLQQLRKHYER